MDDPHEMSLRLIEAIRNDPLTNENEEWQAIAKWLEQLDNKNYGDSE